MGHGTNYTTSNKAPDWDNGTIEAIRHNELINSYYKDTLDYKNNFDYVRDICKVSQDRGIKVILLGSPIYSSYTNTLDTIHIMNRNSFCQAIADMYSNTTFTDLTDSNLFSDSDFYDANHLNEIGAEKFTKLIDNTIYELGY